MILQVMKINTYYGSIHTLHDLSLEVGKPEMIAILGRNGVGKSTTLKSVVGMVPARNGSILFENQELIGKAPFQIARRGIGYVPEERRIFPGLTVRENLIMGLKPGRNESKPTVWTIDRVYQQFTLLAKRDRVLGGNLSGGEQQMLTLMRTLIGNPELILIDEPSEGLSPMMSKMIFETISEIHQEGMSIILVDQNLVYTCKLAKRVYILSKGSVVYSGTGKEVIENRGIQTKYLAV